MPQPPAYNRTKDFTVDFGSETDHSSLNTEMDTVSNSVNDIRTNLAILQADDGKLNPNVVTTYSISADVRNDLSAGILAEVGTSVANAAASATAAALSETNSADAVVQTNASKTAAAASDASALASKNASDINAASALASKNTVVTAEANVTTLAATVASNKTATDANAAAALANKLASDANAATSTTQAGIATTQAAAAAASYDSFDDRYLGPKDVAPALDNDGLALITAALYWDTAIPGMRAYTGTAWTTLPAATAGAVANTPAGRVAATNVQAAINELDTAIANLTDSASLSWNAATDTYTPNTLSASSVTDIHRAMRRCVLKADGTVNYYLHALSSSTLKEDGTASILTGADGNVMVEIPAFYVQYLHVGSTHSWAISLSPKAGYNIHPAFIKAGVQVSHRYIGAYGACINTTGATYQSGLNWDNNVGAGQLWNTTTAKLASVSGVYPAVGATRAEFRAMAENVGAGWHQLDYNLHSAIYLLYIIEFGSFRSQDFTGMGNTQSAYPVASGVQADSPHSVAGKSNASGNASGWLDSTAKDTAWMSYRGIENLYGNHWQFADGFNALLGVPYICGDYTKFADDTAVGYVAAGGQMPAAGGSYIKDIQAYASGFIPSVVGGSSTSYIPDGLWTNLTINTVLLLGGLANAAALSGVGAAIADAASAVRLRSFGARLSR